MIYPFLLLSPCVHPRSSHLRSLHQGTYAYWSTIDSRSSSHFHLKSTCFFLQIFATYNYCAFFHVRCRSPFPSVLWCFLYPFVQSFILRVFLIAPRNHPQTSTPTPYIPPSRLLALLLRLLLSWHKYIP